MAARAQSESLKQRAQGLGFDLVGVCLPVAPPHLDAYRKWLADGCHGTMGYLAEHDPLKADPRSLLPEAQSIIMVGLNYAQPNQVGPGQPRIATYALGRDYHKVMRGKLKRLVEWIQAEHPESKNRICVDSAPIMERDYAQLAGLGWFGKNTLIINSHRGSWFFLGAVLTSVPFETDEPAVGGCGSCHRCVEACPTGAIGFRDGRWQVDARSCISYLTIEHRGEIEPDLTEKMGDWVFGCDVCQEVCPFNQPRSSQPLRAASTGEPDFLAKRNWPSLVQLAQLGEAEWDVLTQGSPTRRTGRDGLRRNARIALQNQEGQAVLAGESTPLMARL